MTFYGAIFSPGSHNFDLSEKLTEIVLKSFLTSFRTLFSVFSLQPIGAEINGGVRTPPPPPVGDGKSGVPVGRGLNVIRLMVR